MRASPSMPYDTVTPGGCNDQRESSLISSTASRLSSLSVYYYKSSIYLYSVQISDVNGVLGTKVPSYSGASGSLAGQVNLSATKYITQLIIFMAATSVNLNGLNCYPWTQFQFTFNDATTQTITTSAFQSTDILYTFSVPTGNQLVGFFTDSDTRNDGWYCTGKIGAQIYYASACVINLSAINGGQKNVVTGTQSTTTFTTDGPLCSFTQYQLTVTGGPKPSLIYLQSSSTPSLTFAATQSLSDAGTYQITVKTSQDSGTTWSAATSATFTYVNPCVTATFFSVSTFNNMLNIEVGSTQVSNSLLMWIDSVTNAINNGTIICAQTMSFYLSSAPSGLANSTFYQKLTFTATSSTSTSGTQTITAAPTLYSEVGAYQITLVGCIVNRPSFCQTTTFQMSVVCSITNVKILQTSPIGILQPQTWIISSSSQLTYQLTVDTSTTCGYSASDWQLSTTSLTKQNCASTYFQSISNSGLFGTGTFSDFSCSAVYNVSVSQVQINSVWYNTIINTVAQPNSFQLTLIDPCQSATVTASLVTNFSLLVYAASTTYGSFASFTYVDANSGTSQCGAFTYTVSLNLGTAINLISTFTLNQATKNFQVQSLNLNQVGTFIATLTGALTSYPSRLVTTTFTVTVLDPCWQTTLSASALSFMSYSVAQVAGCSQQAGTINDAVSSSQSQTLTICGGVTYYQISDTPNAPSSILQSTELSISSSGLINVSTTSAPTVGTHTISVGVKLTSYPNVTLTQTFTLLITACLVTSAKVVQLSNLGSLTAQMYYLSSSFGLTYALSVIQTPACGYSVGGWAVTTTGITGTQPTNFQTISSTTGVYSIAATLTPSQVGQYNVAITGLLINGVQWGGTLTSPSSFTLDVVSACAATIITASSIADISLQVFQGSTTTAYNTFAGFQDSVSTAASVPGLCAISYSASITTNAEGVNLKTFTYNSQQFNIYSDQNNQVGTYTVTLTGTVTQFPTQSAQTTFVITITDPCLTSQINGPQVQNFVAFAGYNQTSSATYTYNDTVSLSRTQAGDIEDYCGGKFFSFQVNGTPTNQFSGNNTEYITFSAPLKSTALGTISAVLKVCLNNYPTVCKSVNFNQTTLSSQPPVVQNQTYTIGQNELNIYFSSFILTPKTYTFSPPLVCKLSAYFFTGSTTISSPIDLASSSLNNILTQNWIKFSEITQSFSILTQDPFYIGNYTIVIVLSLDQFPNVKPFCQFYLALQKATPVVITQTLKPPFFEPALKTQVQNQCPDYNGTLWKFIIPQPSDPNDATVKISVVLSKTFFTFDSSSSTITQLAVPENPINQTIKINLIDSLSQTAQITLLVQFICVQPPQLKLTNSASDVRNQKEWPTAIIQQIEANGVIHIRFNQQMKIPDHPTDIENQTVSINGTDHPILLISIIPGQISDPHMLKFNWTFVKFTTSELQIQLNFENQMYVSSHSQYPDKISLQILGVYLFADSRANYMYPETTLNRFNLPQQTSVASMAKAKAITKSTTNFMQTAMSSNVVISIVISGPINQILGTIRSLQILSHIVLINLAFPATATDFFGGLMSIVTFQFYDFTNFYQKTLNLDSAGSTPYTNQFNLLGYNSLYIVLNFGMLCWTLFVTPLMYVSIQVFVGCFGSQFSHLKQKISSQMFFNNWIKFINETYIFLGLCAALNLYYFYWDNYGNLINSFCAVFFGSLVLIFPFFVILYYNLPNTKVKIKQRDTEFLEKYGAVLEDLNFLRLGQSVLLFPFFSCLRKLCLIYVVIQMQGRPVFSIFFVTFQSVLMIVLIGYVTPFINKKMNTMELVNEAFVLLVTYHLYTFTDFMPDVKTRESVGKSLIVVTITSIVLNFGLVTLTNLSLLARKLKIRKLQWQREQQIQAAYKMRQQKADAAKKANKHKKEAQRQQELLESRQRRLRLQRNANDEEQNQEPQIFKQESQIKPQHKKQYGKTNQLNKLKAPRIKLVSQKFSHISGKDNRRGNFTSSRQPPNQQSFQTRQASQNVISRQTPNQHILAYEWDWNQQWQNQLPEYSYADRPNHEQDDFQVQVERLQNLYDHHQKHFDFSDENRNFFVHPTIHQTEPKQFLSKQLPRQDQNQDRYSQVSEGVISHLQKHQNQIFHNQPFDITHEIQQNNQLIYLNSNYRQEIRPAQTVSSQLKNIFKSNQGKTGIAKLHPAQNNQPVFQREVQNLQQSIPNRRSSLENGPDSLLSELSQNTEMDRVLRQYAEERDKRLYTIQSFRYLDQMQEFVDHGEYREDMPTKIKYWLYNKIVSQRQRFQQNRNW